MQNSMINYVHLAPNKASVSRTCRHTKTAWAGLKRKLRYLLYLHPVTKALASDSDSMPGTHARKKYAGYNRHACGPAPIER